MELSEVSKFDTGNQEQMQPSVSNEKDPSVRGSDRSVHAVKNSQEIESLDLGAECSERNVDTSSEKGENMPSQQAYDSGPSSSRDPRSGETEPTVAEADSSRVNGSLSVSQAAGSGVKFQVPKPVVKEDVPLPVVIAEAGTTQVQVSHSDMTTGSTAEAPAVPKKTDSHVVDILIKDSLKLHEMDGYKGFPIPRTTSNFSVDSATGELCRICQQHSEEPVMELGCHCRGELAKAHRSCIEHWFGNKGTNKCEVCQHVATNVAVPSSQPTPHFWVWRVGGGQYNNNGAHRRAEGVGPLRLDLSIPMRPVLLMTLRRHPTIMLLWLLLFAFMAYLFVDVTDSASIGYAAMPIGFLFGVLVVLGLGTAARLIMECWHERVIRRNIRRMEEEPNLDDFTPDQNTTINIHTQPLQDTSNSNAPVPLIPQTPAIQAQMVQLEHQTQVP